LQIAIGGARPECAPKLRHRDAQLSGQRTDWQPRVCQRVCRRADGCEAMVPRPL